MNNINTWQAVSNIGAKNYTCGYDGCGREVSSERGWLHHDGGNRLDAVIYICPVCKRPTFFDGDTQNPGVAIGNPVRDLPAELDTIWSEIRGSTSRGGYTSAVLAGRKLLMHIAVAQGAPAGENFVTYVNYLVNNHYAPPNSKPWVDKIREHGNEANHEIVLKGKSDAEEIMIFLEMLLKFIYEFPARSKAP
jgi:hypothetical protein